MTERLQQQLRFVKEVDGLKHILRRTKTNDGSRRENDAEHSWELALMALTLEEYAPEGTDMFHVLRLLIFHDIVELDAGDTFAFDQKGHLDKAEREQEAAERIFGLLPPEQAALFRQWWEEYEAQTTKESHFALCMDRLQPFLHNLYNDGGTWQEFDVEYEQVLERNRPWAPYVPELWEAVQVLAKDAVEAGVLREGGVKP